ncbi:MAG: peptidoglycan-binding protein [Saprospirales bacterium]|nr:peptidoglycan-binding protein [Saprospirales bacterium]
MGFTGRLGAKHLGGKEPGKEVEQTHEQVVVFKKEDYALMDLLSIAARNRKPIHGYVLREYPNNAVEKIIPGTRRGLLACWGFFYAQYLAAIYIYPFIVHQPKSGLRSRPYTMNTILRLGNFDEGKMPASRTTFLEPYHTGMSNFLKLRKQFRDEANGVWRGFVQVPGTAIRDLQQFLKDSGFMPKANVDGVFGYGTQAAVRLFQEYVRSIGQDPSIGVPDGVVGQNTLAKIEKWKADHAGQGQMLCEWGKSSAQKPAPEFERWLGLLKSAQAFYSRNPGPILQKTEAYTGATDTKKLKDWDFSPNSIHLIGIRRSQEVGAARRENDDLFVLLIRGMVFRFWGSTDPNPGLAERADIPFLVEGQHEYQFGWHKVNNNQTIYRALRPAGPGVLVFRDVDKNMALTETDIDKGIDKKPNTTINIHWSGIGTTNFSAGCQVIAGRSYLNNHGELIDCSGFSAISYADLAKGKTRGAYNVFADLILSYAPPGVRTLRYTLGRDETFRNFPDWDASFVDTDVRRMRGMA